VTSNNKEAPRRQAEVPPEERPPLRRGEMYTSQQACWRMNIGEKTLKTYQSEGLEPSVGSPTRNETTNLMWDGDVLIDFLKARRSKG
jgi:hypothetical protein